MAVGEALLLRDTHFCSVTPPPPPPPPPPLPPDRAPPDRENKPIQTDEKHSFDISRHAPTTLNLGTLLGGLDIELPGGLLSYIAGLGRLTTRFCHARTHAFAMRAHTLVALGR
jgi:hypothetical protein